MKDGNFRPPTESTPFNQSPKNLSQVIMSVASTAVPNWLQISLRRLLGKLVKYNEIFFIYLHLFFGSSPARQTP